MANGSSLADFNPRPTLPSGTISRDLQLLIQQASRVVGDGIEEEPLVACQQIILHPTAPFQLKRWATLNQVRLLSFCKAEATALDLAQEWLNENEEADPNPLAIRSVCTKIVSERRHDRFQPTFEQIRRAFEDLFNHHEGTEWDVIEAHLGYAQRCHIEAFDVPSLQIIEDRVAHLMLAEGKLMDRLRVAEEAGDGHTKDLCDQKLQQMVRPELEDAISTLDRAAAREHANNPRSGANRPAPAEPAASNRPAGTPR